MKKPVTETGKKSFPGVLKVVRNADGVPVIYPVGAQVEGDNVLEVVYDKGPVKKDWESFAQVRERVEREWAKTPKAFDPISPELKQATDKWITDFNANWAQRNKAE